MKPILFNTEMVKAILDGRKTVTRRVLNPTPLWEESPVPQVGHPGYWANWDDEKIYKAPYCPGDILYVRETWCLNNFGWHYRADWPGDNCPDMCADDKWHPSIHMPKEAARLFLRVTDVRVERLQDITELQILEEEGIKVDFPQPKPSYISLAYAETRLKPEVKRAFSKMWDSTIKKADLDKYGWAANPWVWVIEFERISKEEALKGGAE